MRDVKKRLSFARKLSGDLLEKLETFGRVLHASIQGIETKFSRLEMCVSTRNSDLENLKQETAHLEEVLRAVQEKIKIISENQREPEKSASDETTQRCVRAQQVQFGLADRTKRDNGQKNGESQTREAAAMDGEEIQLLCDGKLILHRIV